MGGEYDPKPKISIKRRPTRDQRVKSLNDDDRNIFKNNMILSYDL